MREQREGKISIQKSEIETTKGGKRQEQTKGRRKERRKTDAGKESEEDRVWKKEGERAFTCVHKRNNGFTGR